MRRLPLTLIFVAAGLASGCGARTSEDDLLGGGPTNPGVGDGDGDGDISATGGVIPPSGGGPGRTGGGPGVTGGGPAFNDCCVTSGSPGCNTLPYQECVCDFDPYCCDEAWDEACVDGADRLCGAGCSVPTGGVPGIGGMPGVGGGVVTGGIAGVGGGVVTGGMPGIGGGVVTGGMPGIGGSGGTFGGNCCETHGGTGCQQPEVSECVCAMDPFCCEVSWDGICVNEARLDCGATCGDPPTGGAPGTGGFGGTGGIIDQCISAFPDECGTCLCQNCFDQLQGCFADFGCLAILNCIDQSACVGLGCYQADTCQPVIDFFGGLNGPSAGTAFGLGTCADGASCACD